MRHIPEVYADLFGSANDIRGMVRSRIENGDHSFFWSGRNLRRYEKHDLAKLELELHRDVGMFLMEVGKYMNGIDDIGERFRLVKTIEHRRKVAAACEYYRRAFMHWRMSDLKIYQERQIVEWEEVQYRANSWLENWNHLSQPAEVEGLRCDLSKSNPKRKAEVRRVLRNRIEDLLDSLRDTPSSGRGSRLKEIEGCRLDICIIDTQGRMNEIIDIRTQADSRAKLIRAALVAGKEVFG